MHSYYRKIIFLIPVRDLGNRSPSELHRVKQSAAWSATCTTCIARKQQTMSGLERSVRPQTVRTSLTLKKAIDRLNIQFLQFGVQQCSRQTWSLLATRLLFYSDNHIFQQCHATNPTYHYYSNSTWLVTIPFKVNNNTHCYYELSCMIYGYTAQIHISKSLTCIPSGLLNKQLAACVNIVLKKTIF